MTTAKTELTTTRTPTWHFWATGTLVLFCVWQIVAGSAVLALLAAATGAVLIARNSGPRSEALWADRAVQVFLWSTVALGLFMVLVLGGY